VRRRFREAYRRIKSGLPDRVYLVFVGRKGISELGWNSLLEEMDAVLAKAGLARL